MNFNVYLEAPLAKKLGALARRTGTKRNALIRQAVAKLVAEDDARWPAMVLAWTGDPDFPPFEATREELRIDADDDPFRGVERRRPKRRR